MTEIKPFSIDVPDADIEDLRRRLRRTRWGATIPGVGWARGVPGDYLADLVAYWADGYDWRAQEARLNRFPQFTTEIDGQTIHFAHVRSANENATPLILTYDWPGSIVTFIEVIEPLSQDFHVVVPHLPGFAFSGPLSSTGWTVGRTATAFNQLMDRLGHDRYGIQGSGGGGGLAVEMGRQRQDKVIGVHVNGHLTFPSGDPDDFTGLTEAEQERLARLQHFRDDMMGFNIVQSTRPHTIAHALTDSPAGQLAWIAEKYKEWTDTAADLPEDAVGRDNLLTNVSLHWFTGTAATAANLYYETQHDPSAWGPKGRSEVPLGVALAKPTDITIRRFAERDAPVVHWTELERGGNFLALEQPGRYLQDVKAFFDAL